MSVSSVIAPTTPASTSKATQAGVGLAKDFNTFLTLLTSQLQHQDPLDPMKSNEFTQQLVSFTGVEQQINTNKNLESLIASMAAQQTGNAVNYLGSQVTAQTNQGQLSGGAAAWTYNLPTTASQADITIMDARGVTVYKGTADPTAGTHTFNWDGKSSNGTAMPDGIYTMNVAAATADGTAVNSSVFQRGVVTSIDTANGQSQLSLSGLLIPMSSVISVGLPQSASNSATPKTTN